MQLVISVHPYILAVIDHCFCVIEKDSVTQMWIVEDLGKDARSEIEHRVKLAC